MFNCCQNGACVEVFSAQEKSPLAHWNVSGITKVNRCLCSSCINFFSF